MGGSFQLFIVRGIAVRVHFTFPLILVWAVVQFGGLSEQRLSGALLGVIVTLLLFAIVVLHELGHSFAAQYFGVPVKEIILLPLGGLARLDHIPEDPMKEFIIAIAGPAVNVGIAGILFIFGTLTGLGSGFDNPAQFLSGPLDARAIFAYVSLANISLAVFNLLPAFPMDGGRVLRALLASRLSYARATAIAVSVGRSMAGLLGLLGFLGGGVFLILIAVFVYMGAGYEGRVVQLRSALRDLTVEQAYSRHAQTLKPDTTIKSAIDLTLSSFQADFPVCDGDRLVGLLPYHRLIESLNQLPATTPVQQVMLTDVAPIQPTDSIFDVQQRMTQEKLDAIPVVDGDRFLGLLTSRDVNEIYRLGASLPNVLGRMRDTDSETPMTDQNSAL
jgi:stage IV sporulation protein FB